MRFNGVIRYQIIVCCLLTINLNAQIKSFGTKAKRKPEPNYLFSVYGYYDFVREYGVGVQYHFLPQYSIDFTVYKIYPYSALNFVGQWDYKDFTGQGICLKPKFHFSSLGKWFISPNFSYEWLQHDVVPVAVYNGRGSMYIYHYQEEAKGTAYTIGFTFGNKIRVKQLFIEPFFGLGLTNAKLTKTTYGVDHQTFEKKDFPYTKNIRRNYLQSNLGIKIGLTFKKSKKHQAIDKKFDELYLPKSDSLKAFFKTVTKEQLQQNKNQRLAYYMYKKLNSSSLRRYRKYYNDTTHFYQKMDDLFIQIEKLINYGIPTTE